MEFPADYKIGVVKNRFDDVAAKLSAWRISYEELSLEQLLLPQTYERYNALFLPCGMEPPLHERMAVNAKGNAVASVTVNPAAADINEDDVAFLLRNFLDSGGRLYVSGFAFKYLQATLDYPLIFFADMPYIGESGNIRAFIYGDLAAFSNATSLPLSMGHYGWVAVKEISEGEVLANATFDTPFGRQVGPVCVAFRKGDGEAFYTSYHSQEASDLSRFIIYRLAGRRLEAQAAAKASLWEQTITARITDAVHAGEPSRRYKMRVRAGANSLHFVASAAGMLACVTDEAGDIIRSQELEYPADIIDVDAASDGFCTVRIFPDKSSRNSAYTIISAAGMRVIPHYGKAAIAALCLGLILVVLFTAFSLKTANSADESNRRIP